MSYLKPYAKKPLPKAPRLKDLLGPSFVLLGLGLGSGELILWPFLASNYGMGIVWGAVLGITFQFFLNMEIERYALAKGESVFVGFARKFGKVSPLWFILSTLIPWMWPGIIASSGLLISHAFSINYGPVLPSLLLIIIGGILTLGPVIYKTQEKFNRTLIMVGVPFMVIMALMFADAPDFSKLATGLIGKGEGYWFLPAGISIATFLGAFAYAGAGGNLNLAQSYYVKEKGYGMGKYSGRLTSVITGKKEKITLEGAEFEETEDNFKTFSTWWRRINIEHALIFWATGAFTMITLSFLAYNTVYKAGIASAGINFLIMESQAISQNTLPALGTAFIAISAVMLFMTQLSVFDATSRIMGENLVIVAPSKFKIENLQKYYYSFLWMQIGAGILIFFFGTTQPLGLVVISAVLNAIAMFVFSGLMIILNKSLLPKRIRPNALRLLIVFIAFAFYGVFSAITIYQNFNP